MDNEKIRYIEFVAGHKDEDVSKDEATEKVEKAMKDGDYVAIEQEDGKTVTSVDIENESKKEAKGDKKKEAKIKKEKTKKAVKNGKEIKQIKPVSGG